MGRESTRVMVASGLIVSLLFIAAASEAVMLLSKESTSIGNTVMLNAESDPASNGTALLNALAALAGSPTNRYVLKLGPGIYDVGATNIAMKNYVDIEGSGESVTVITGNPDGPATVTAFGISDAELRNLSVKNTGGGTLAVAIGTGGEIGITHVYAFAKGANKNHAIENHCPSPPCGVVMMQNVSAEVVDTGGSENIGIQNTANAAVGMVNVIVNVSGKVGTTVGANTNIGIQNTSTAPTMLEVYVMANGGANTYGMQNDNTNGQMFNVYVFATNATGDNIGILNQNSSAPIMRNMRTEASGGTNSIGLSNKSCGTAVTTVTAMVALGRNATSTNIGILNDTCSHIYFASSANSTPANAGAAHYGIKNVDASPRIESSLIFAPNNDANCGGGCYGVHSTSTGGAYTVKIDSTQIYTAPTASSAATISNGTNVTTYVGNSKLDGNAVKNSGTVKCIGAYNATYDPLNNSTCLYP